MPLRPPNTLNRRPPVRENARLHILLFLPTARAPAPVRRWRQPETLHSSVVQAYRHHGLGRVHRLGEDVAGEGKAADVFEHGFLWFLLGEGERRMESKRNTKTKTIDWIRGQKNVVFGVIRLKGRWLKVGSRAW